MPMPALGLASSPNSPAAKSGINKTGGMTKKTSSQNPARPAPAIGVSACLLGMKVRWDGGHKQDWYVRKVLAKHFELVAICPENECGLGIPREPVRLEGDPDRPRLFTLNSRIELTGKMEAWIERRLGELEQVDLCGFVFKAKSPSCGLKSTKIFGNGSVFLSGRGLFAAAFTKRFPAIPVVEENDLHDPLAKAIFIEKLTRFGKLR